MEKKRHVIALAGQKKLYGEMELLSNRLQYESSFLDFDLIVLTPFLTPYISPNPSKDEIDTLHRYFDRKIEMCDIMMVITWNHYVGSDTFREIITARRLDKAIQIVDIRTDTFDDILNFIKVYFSSTETL